MDLKSYLDFSQIIVNVTGVVLLGVTIWNLRFASRSFKKQMNAQVYLAYTERYEKLMADCPLDFRTTLLDLRLADVEVKDRDKINVCMLRYLNLCSEEFHLMQTGYLAPEVWGLWRQELEWTLRKPLYVSGWPELRHEFESYPEFRQYVEEVQDSASDISVGSPHRRSSGGGDLEVQHGVGR
jgi:hypothetical protein